MLSPVQHRRPYGKQGAQVLRFLYALALDGATLVVADTANNRLLFWPNVAQAENFQAATTRHHRHWTTRF